MEQYMEQYKVYLSNLLGVEKLEFINYDRQGYYFNGINKGNILEIKVIGKRVFINKSPLNIIVEDPFEFNNSLR